MNKGEGFTLIELMIVVAIIALLAMIGYPNYVEYGVRAKRVAAQSFMLELASKQERYVLDNRAYTGTVTDLIPTIPENVSGNYNVTIPVVSATRYTISAAPKGSQASNDTKCGTLTLNQAGIKTKSGTGSAQDCWKG